MTTGARTGVRRSSPRRRRKNLILDQTKIDRAKAILGVPTETEAIDRALDTVADLAAFGREVDIGLAGLIGRGGFKLRLGPGRSRR